MISLQHREALQRLGITFGASLSTTTGWLEFYAANDSGVQTLECHNVDKSEARLAVAEAQGLCKSAGIKLEWIDGKPVE